MAEPERLLSVDEAAERLGLSPLTVADKLRAGALPGFKYGRLWRLREIDLDEYVRQLAEAGAAEQAARAVAAKRKAAGLPPKKTRASRGK